MPNLPPDDDGDLADNIFGTATYETHARQKKDFFPWHKPRKQYVRHHQWCEQIKALLSDMQPESNTLKYLGLPGTDLLDLRYFHSQVCEPKDIRLRFLGFNIEANPKSRAQTELNISLDEVRKLSLIHPLSEVIWDDFCLVANVSSNAYRKTWDCGPYDVINLDLCHGFGMHEPGILDNTHYNAMNRLMALQAKNKQPWLLFLTTRAGKKEVHPGLMQKLIDKYAQNLADCVPFKEASAQIFEIGDEAAMRAAADTPGGHLTVFLVGLCNWLLGLAVRPPPSKVEIKSVIGYRVDEGAEHDDLISLALRFEPTDSPANDPLGLANNPLGIPPSECDLSAKAVKRLGKRKCADEILAADPELYREMVSATESLLALARYDVDAFRAWLRAG